MLATQWKDLRENDEFSFDNGFTWHKVQESFQVGEFPGTYVLVACEGGLRVWGSEDEEVVVKG